MTVKDRYLRMLCPFTVCISQNLASLVYASVRWCYTGNRLMLD